MIRLARPLAGLLGCLIVAGCAAALNLAAPDPPRLFSLTPKSTFAEDLPAVEARLSVEVPTATAGLNTSRIALRPTATTLEYYARASWIDVVPVMVQTLLIETFDNTGKVDVLGRGTVGVRAEFALLTHVREFQAEYDDNNSPPNVRVRLQARLIQLPRRTSLRATSEEAVVRANSTSMQAIVQAYDEAYGKAMKRVVEWTLREIAEAKPSGR